MANESPCLRDAMSEDLALTPALHVVDTLRRTTLHRILQQHTHDHGDLCSISYTYKTHMATDGVWSMLLLMKCQRYGPYGLRETRFAGF